MIFMGKLSIFSHFFRSSMMRSECLYRNIRNFPVFMIKKNSVLSKKKLSRRLDWDSIVFP